MLFMKEKTMSVAEFLNSKKESKEALEISFVLFLLLIMYVVLTGDAITGFTAVSPAILL